MLIFMLVSTFSYMLASLTAKNPHPVKLSMILLGLSMSLFLLIYLHTANSWYPTIFFLIFMGGILMMFMVLSSILPNEKSIKSKMSVVSSLFLVSLVIMPKSKSLYLEETPNLVKMNLESSSSLAFLVGAMLMYFFMTLSSLSKSESPLRSHICCKEKKFCKFLLKSQQS